MFEITSRADLRYWLKARPAEFAQVIAARAALRALPDAFIGTVVTKWVNENALGVIRAMAISWAARNIPAHDMVAAARAAALVARAAALAVYAATDAAYAAVRAAADAADAAHAAADAAHAAAYVATWNNVSADCDWLGTSSDGATDARRLTRERLWLRSSSFDSSKRWEVAADRLTALDPSYQVWIDWYNRRIKGEDAAFDIPGDTNRTEDKKILIKLADATDEDFWGKGATHVNTTLQSWIDEARERAAVEEQLPPQEDGATAYGANDQGRLDRLPPSDQQHLRDVPNQQRAYQDVRDAALALYEEGQRLGPKLEPALSSFIESMPEAFEDAEVYLVWRDGVKLRRRYRAHLAVINSPDPDPAKLDLVVAEGLGELLDLFNPFAFGDDGIRAKDTQRIPEQEIVTAQTEAEAAVPIIKAILANPDIGTDRAIDDIEATLTDASLPTDDPYAAQVLDQSNRTRRNWFSALLSAAASEGREIKKGALWFAGGAIVSDAAGVTQIFPGLAEFAVKNIGALRTYAETAFASFNLGWLWTLLSGLG